MKAQNTSRRLRIALVPPLWAQVAPATKGGVEYIVYLLAEELVKRCHEVTVFTSSDSPTSARIDALCQWNMIEAMERNRAWEYEYYETCNIAETLQKSDSFDVIHFHVGCYAIPLGVLSRAPALHTLHNPITPDAIWLLGRYANAPVTAVSRQQIAVLKDAGALLFPIQAEEAFGLVMIEAMACGTPVIAFQRGSVEEVVDFGKTGFYADSMQVLASFVPRALSLDRRVVREHAKQRFGHVRMVDEYLQAYEAILKARWNGRASLTTARKS